MSTEDTESFMGEHSDLLLQKIRSVAGNVAMLSSVASCTAVYTVYKATSSYLTAWLHITAGICPVVIYSNGHLSSSQRRKGSFVHTCKKNLTSHGLKVANLCIIYLITKYLQPNITTSIKYIFGFIKFFEIHKFI